MKKYVLLFLLLSLSGCDRFTGMSQEKPLPGERLSILKSRADIVADSQAGNVSYPSPWVNTSWPQNGGYPHHAMGNLSLGSPLKKTWSADIGTAAKYAPVTAQPVVAEGVAWTLDAKGMVTAFDIRKGKKLWRVSSVAPGEETDGALGGGIAWAAGKLYVTNGYKQLTALDANTGAMIWRTIIPSPARVAPTVSNDKIYVMTMDNRLMVFSAADGTPIWSYAGTTETTSLMGSVSPAVGDVSVLFPTSSGELISLRIENGQEIWSDRLSGVVRTSSFGAIADIRGAPVIDQGTVFAGSNGGRIAALDLISGQRLWQIAAGSAEMPWVAGNTVFVLTTDQQLLALSRDKGQVRWVAALPKFKDNAKLKPIVWTGPVLAGNRLIVASSDGQKMDINPETGAVLHQETIGDPVTIAPVVADNMLFLLTENGRLVVYK